MPSTLEQLLTAQVFRHLLQCPRCLVGSPAREWTAPTAPA